MSLVSNNIVCTHASNMHVYMKSGAHAWSHDKVYRSKFVSVFFLVNW